MAETVIRFTFDKDALWRKVCNRKPIFLDMNCWINMAEDKSAEATRVKDMLRAAVSKADAFCPLSFGLLFEICKQRFDSRLRVGELMESLSLNVAYAIKDEVFAWEVQQFVSRKLGVGPIDMSYSGLYVPLILYMSSKLNIGYPEERDCPEMKEKVEGLRNTLESLTLTEILKMSMADGEDWEGQHVRSLPNPPFTGVVQRIREWTKGNKRRMLMLEAQEALSREVYPILVKSSPQVQKTFQEYIFASKDKAPENKAAVEQYTDFLLGVLDALPTLYNHVELCVTISQNPTQRFEVNDWFDYEIMPIPLAYASAFVSHDKGIRDLLRNRTEILKRNPSCCYCSNLSELEAWLKAEGLA